MAGGSSTFQLTGIGSTEMLPMPPPNSVMHHLQRNLHPTIWGVLDNPSDLAWQMEASPDGLVWVPIKGFVDLQVSQFNIFTGYCYAIRGTVTAYISGKFTLFANWTL
jgi:hypothetical protein